MVVVVAAAVVVRIALSNSLMSMDEFVECFVSFVVVVAMVVFVRCSYYWARLCLHFAFYLYPRSYRVMSLYS